MPRIILLGPPGSGKGTQGAIITHEHDIPVISSGEALRGHLESGTPLGQQARQYIEAGELVPDDLVIDFVEDLLEEKSSENGFLLDGYPRTTRQAEALDVWLAERGLKLDAVFYLEVPREILLERIANRRACMSCEEDNKGSDNGRTPDEFCRVCGSPLVRRTDDEPETAARRIDIYNERTKPLVDYYANKGILVEIDGRADIWAQQEVINNALGEI